MKKNVTKVLLVLFLIAVAAPYCLEDFGIKAYSYHLMSSSGSGEYTTEYVAHRGNRYGLFFQSYNYNVLNSEGTVYAYR